MGRRSHSSRGLSSVYAASGAKGEKSISIMVIVRLRLTEMTKEKPTPGDVIRYRDKRNGGWYHAILVRMGYKWATVKDYWPSATPKRHRVLASDVETAVFS